MLIADDSEEPGLQIRSGAEAFNVVDGTHEGLLNEVISADTIARQRTCEGMQLGHEGHHVICHHLLATFLSRPSGMKAIGWLARYLPRLRAKVGRWLGKGGGRVPR